MQQLKLVVLDNQRSRKQTRGRDRDYALDKPVMLQADVSTPGTAQDQLNTVLHIGEFARLAETRLAQYAFDYINISLSYLGI